MRYIPVGLVLGAPLCNNNPKAPLYAPVGQQELYRTLLRRDGSPGKIGRSLFMEWFAVADALKQMKVDFTIAMPPLDVVEKFLPGILEVLQSEGITTTELPCADLTLIAFPRDLAICLPNGVVLLNDTVSPIPASWSENMQLVRSPFGEGGRIHIAGNVAIIPCNLTFVGGKEWKPPVGHHHLKVLHEAGLRTCQVHNPVYYKEEGDLKGFIPDDHLDRVSGMLRDKAGALHIVVDPQIHSGWSDVFQPPQMSSAQTIDSWRRTCGEAGITLHIPPKPLTVPMACGFMQLRDGRVIATGGDEQIAEILTGIVGSDQVTFTSIPIQYFPVQAKAGIRCLLNYLPKAFLDKI